MARRISKEKIKLIQNLHSERQSVANIARIADVSCSTVFGYTKARERGFGSLMKYHEQLARQKGFASYDEYLKFLIRKRGFESLKEYYEHLAMQKGFTSNREYRKYKAKKKQERAENQELSYLIQSRLEETGKTQSWLAREVDAPRQAVFSYAKGISIPNGERLERIFSALGVNYKTLDDLIVMYNL